MQSPFDLKIRYGIETARVAITYNLQVVCLSTLWRTNERGGRVPCIKVHCASVTPFEILNFDCKYSIEKPSYSQLVSISVLHSGNLINNEIMSSRSHRV